MLADKLMTNDKRRTMTNDKPTTLSREHVGGCAGDTLLFPQKAIYTL